MKRKKRKSPNDLDALTREDLLLVGKLEKEIAEELQHPNGVYKFNNRAGSLLEYTDQIKREVLKMAKRGGYIVSELYGDGDFTVRRP